MVIRAAAAALVITLVVIAGVQFADPEFTDRRPPEVDFSEPPAEVAADAANQFDYIDYSYRLWFAYNRSDEWYLLREMWVDRTDREYYKLGVSREQGTVLYGTESVGYYRPGEGARWQVDAHPDLRYPPAGIAQPFLTDRIREANATVVTENSSVVVIDVDVHPLTTVSALPGHATIYIEKPSGRLVRADVVYNTDRRQNYFRFQYTGAGVDVDRPGEISVTVSGLFWDLVRGPVFELYDD